VTEKPLAFLSLVKLIEKAVGQKTGYSMLDPFPCKTLEAGRPAIVTIQNAGRIISRHIGLADYIFVISITAQKQDTGGHIELDHNGSDVFVELSPSLCQYKDAVLATLSHELSHKFLHLHGIRNGTVQIEQEFLTDVTAVYLGMGKIMLNGCECHSTLQSTQGDRTITQTHTLKTGYISRECFAFVYRLVCAMRGINSTDFLSGLSIEAIDAVRKCERDYGDWFRPEYRNIDGVAALVESFNEAVSERQESASLRHRDVRRIEESLESVRTSINDSHRPIIEAKRRIASLAEPEPNLHLKYLNCIETREAVAEYTDRADRQIQGLRSGLDQILKALPLLRQTRSEGANEVVECPIDGTKLRVPAGRRRLLVTCPSCKYSFIVNTASEEELPQKDKEVGRFTSFWRFVTGGKRRLAPNIPRRR
jgi:hypothetical protein